MKSFKYSYQADLKRYNGNADTYIRIWLFYTVNAVIVRHQY